MNEDSEKEKNYGNVVNGCMVRVQDTQTLQARSQSRTGIYGFPVGYVGFSGIYIQIKKLI